jgi:LPS-assembly lipoprotein
MNYPRTMIELRAKLAGPLLVVILVGLLPACGFHLRGVANLPPELQSIELQSENLSVNQTALLRRNLERSGANLSNDGSSQRVTLKVAIKSLPDRNLADSIGANSVVVRVSRQLSYSLTSDDGVSLLEKSSIERHIDLTLDNNNPLGIEFERESAQESLDRELVIQLILILEQFQMPE